jgi:hypothetical protein
MEIPRDVLLTSQQTPEWVKLIRKLRWIGLTNEAQQLEQVVGTLHPDENLDSWIGSFTSNRGERLQL